MTYGGPQWPQQQPQQPWPPPSQSQWAPQPSPPRGTSPVVAILAAIGGLVVLGGGAVAALVLLRGNDAPSALATPAMLGPRTMVLPSRLTRCELDRTGFLGIGNGRVALVAVHNDGDQPGIFTVGVDGQYPGGGRVHHGEQALPITAHGDAIASIRFEQNDGMTGVECTVQNPTVAVP